MAIFASRSSGYKWGLVALFVCCLLYLIGYASPFWVKAEAPGIKMYQGLWMACIDSHTLDTCAAFEFRHLKGWFHGVRLLSSVGFSLLLGSCIYGVVVNCCSSAPRHSRALEGLALSGGISCFIGAMVFVGKYDDLTLFQNLGELSWAFYLATVGCAAVILASIVVWVTNKPSDVPPTGPVVVANAGGFPPGVVVERGGIQSASYPGPSVVAGHPYGASAPVYYTPPPQAGYPSLKS